MKMSKNLLALIICLFFTSQTQAAPSIYFDCICDFGTTEMMGVIEIKNNEQAKYFHELFANGWLKLGKQMNLLGTCKTKSICPTKEFKPWGEFQSLPVSGPFLIEITGLSGSYYKIGSTYKVQGSIINRP